MTDLTFDMTEDFNRTVARSPADADTPSRGSDYSGSTTNGSTEPAQPRDTLRIPRIAIEAFCSSPDVAAVIEKASADRLMARARVSVSMGGVAAAVEHYRQAPTPNLVVVESRSANSAFLAELDQLAEVCDTGTRVMAIGHTNDIAFFRELMKRGVSEYVLAPVDPVSLIASVSSIYGEKSTGKLGQTYAFIGAKGGVGSSTIAHNVSWTIARHLSSDVVLTDMDLAFGTASLNFNLDAGLGVAEAIQDISRLDEMLLERLLVKYDDHLSLLTAPAVLDKPYDLQETAIEALIEVAQSSVPYMVLDMPSIWTAWAKGALVSADEIVITASPDLANLRNAKNLISILRQARPNDPPPKLVLNQVGMPKRPEIKPSEFAKALQVEPIACIAFEPSLFGAAANKGQMVAEASSKGAASKAFTEIAQIITGRQELKRARRGALGLGSIFGKMKRRTGAQPAKGA